MTEKTYTPDQMEDAKKLAQALVSVPSENRFMFTLMVESMLIGAELAEKRLVAAERKANHTCDDGQRIHRGHGGSGKHGTHGTQRIIVDHTKGGRQDEAAAVKGGAD